MSTKSLNSSADTDKYRLFKAEISDLKFFYRRIFGEDISDDEIIKKSSCNKFVILVLSNSKEEKIGISVLRYFDDCVSLWLFGIIPEARRKGIGQKLLEETEAFVLASGFSKIRLSTYNIRKEMLSLAIKNDYKIYGVDKGHYGDGLKIRMNKTIHPVKCNSSKTQGNKKEVRFLLSVNCNYDCFFCHMEGLDSNFKYENNGDDFLAVLKNVITCGYNDVTFTGGEPANSKKLLLNAIDLCNSLTAPPALTIVTNGSLWNDTLIKAVSVYSGELKINFSAHSLDPQKYEKITQTSGCYDKAINNLRALIAAGIKVKLNCVILKSVNDSPEELIRYISDAHSLGVFSIKFLELLVTEEYAENFKYFTSADSIARTLSESGFSEDNKALRARYFSNQDYPGLKIEVVQCTCKMGCGKCHTVR
ncbi:MAG: GNAT family N-acetyltransferase, partial [Lentisphaerota bacterium]